MEFDTEFALTADADTAWRALLDVPRVAPLMPGAVLDASEDAEHHGRVKIKFGATTITFKGVVRTAVVDDLTRTAIFEATAREARGAGTAEAVFQATVLPTPDGCRVILHTRATFTGRAAALPTPLIQETATKLLTRFATSLTPSLTPQDPPSEPLPQPPGTADEPSEPLAQAPSPTDEPSEPVAQEAGPADGPSDPSPSDGPSEQEPDPAPSSAPLTQDPSPADGPSEPLTREVAEPTDPTDEPDKADAPSQPLAQEADPADEPSEPVAQEAGPVGGPSEAVAGEVAEPTVSPEEAGHVVGGGGAALADVPAVDPVVPPRPEPEGPITAGGLIDEVGVGGKRVWRLVPVAAVVVALLVVVRAVTRRRAG
ncbi:SRPBCC family protein [Actinocorallia sp. A-T 12471]|uniref:SRPBCC family protein n=1 Tax=Actinocorallia sp. A-T 12471 TaxID=3089813 RepID=UPI0029CDADD2|nr:SRPBCC domain-containing protein [Actinocorallia sp. A-T 12471]MDX6744449.1 SRPBCC domain-containing protein [Actinocorallia sp. A-T 12471]